jgi:hypothetical protein
MQNSVVIALLACAVCARAASYTTYIGDANQYQVSAIATDANGNTYITGSRIIEPNAPSPNGVGVTDVFVSKLDPSGNLTLLGTFSGKGLTRRMGSRSTPPEISMSSAARHPRIFRCTIRCRAPRTLRGRASVTGRAF